ncbi:extensin-like [Girardinichthys multiradiatus]|uniref:extensin-like n=1 Tax=Girardinichthys multiradiatus TaxID=208333 RepID=UPI001FACC2C8|nr:extensin-like [Girardinichthys multiradiatus]
MLPQPLPTGATGQTSSSTAPTTEPPTTHQDGTNLSGKRSPASDKHSGLPRETYYPAQLYHCRSADPNTGNPTSKKRTQSLHPICCSTSSPTSSPLPRSCLGRNSQLSSTPPSPPNHPASASSPSPFPLVHERETCTSRVTGSGRSTAPGQAQSTSHTSAGTRHAPLPHPPASQPHTPTPKPRICPKMPATHTPTRYTPLHEAGRLASPSTKLKPHLN